MTAMSHGGRPVLNGREISREQQILAARILVKVDPIRGVDTPQWIRDLARQKV